MIKSFTCHLFQLHESSMEYFLSSFYQSITVLHSYILWYYHTCSATNDYENMHIVS